MQTCHLGMSSFRLTEVCVYLSDRSLPQVMLKVFQARWDLVYQLALVPSELREIFASAPPIEPDARKEDQDGKRKPIEGDCPICFSPLEDGEDIVFCRSTCGQNMHADCFKTWASTKRSNARDPVTCPMCRSTWEGDDDMVKKIKRGGVVSAEGYVNVADQLGIDRVRGMAMRPRCSDTKLTMYCRRQHISQTILSMGLGLDLRSVLAVACFFGIVRTFTTPCARGCVTASVRTNPPTVRCKRHILQDITLAGELRCSHIATLPATSARLWNQAVPSRAAFIFASSSSVFGTVTSIGTVAAFNLRKTFTTVLASTHIQLRNTQTAK